MSIIGSNILAGAAGSGVSAYEIEQSLRFDGGARLYRTQPASQTRTYSFWYKYSDLDGGNSYLFHHKNSDDSRYLGVRSGGSPSENQWQTLNQGSSFTQIFVSGVKFRDPAAWQHFVFKCTGSNVTQYINGVEYGSAGGANVALTGGTLEIGARGSAEYFGGYIAEFHFVDGTALDPDSFGEEDDNGVWRPIEYTGSYGSNGVYLKFDPTATNGIGHDHSGNGNNFTASGFTTSGTGTDVMSDTPTTNWCTLNPLDAGTSGMLSDGNLIFNLGSGSDYIVRATQGMSSGKWYAEWTYNSGVNSYVGIASYAASLSGYLGQDQYGYAYDHAGDKYNNNSGTSYGATYTHGDIIGIAFDADAGSLTFYKNGTSQGTAFTGLSSFPYFFAHGANNCNGTFNFGQRAFAYTPPTGFKALNTSNLPAPTVKDGSKNFNTVLWTGNGSSQAITGVGFQPDFLWAKARNQSYSHRLHDAVRGREESLLSNSSGAEFTQANSITSFDTDGFTLGSDGSHNGSGVTYVGWNWLAGNGTSSNTDGSITSTVSANPTAGFSIVSYTGTGANATVGHGLGVAPSFILTKNRTDTSNWNWWVQHASLGATQFLILNSTAAAASATDVWNDTAPTSTVFSIGNSGGNNGSGEDIIAYCFAEVEGYSKFGSYTGNGSTDGTFVYCGFKPAWIMVKTSSNAYNWAIHDTTRQTYNEDERILEPNTSGAEATNSLWGVDILSNGFKWRNNGEVFNFSGYTYIFAAFAEHPTGGSGISPATAR